MQMTQHVKIPNVVFAASAYRVSLAMAGPLKLEDQDVLVC